jgi:hypothetical protein
MPVRPVQTFPDLAPERGSLTGSGGFVDPEARVQGRVDEVADRVEGDGERSADESDQRAAERRSHRLRRRVGLIETRIGVEEAITRHEAREQ